MVACAGWPLASPGHVRRSSTGAARSSSATRLTSAHATGLRHDPRGPPGGERLPGGAMGGARAACASRQHPAPAEPAQRRHQGQGGRGDAQHRDRGCEAERVVRRQPAEPQAHQGDEHGGRGERHRPPCGPDRAAGGLDRVVAEPQVLHVAHDEQERVVDPHAQPHHRGDRGGGGADVHRPGEQGDAGGARGQPGDGHPDRQPGADGGPQGEQQDQQGGAEPDQLAGAAEGLPGRVGQVAPSSTW